MHSRFPIQRGLTVSSAGIESLLELIPGRFEDTIVRDAALGSVLRSCLAALVRPTNLVRDLSHLTCRLGLGAKWSFFKARYL